MLCCKSNDAVVPEKSKREELAPSSKKIAKSVDYENFLSPADEHKSIDDTSVICTKTSGESSMRVDAKKSCETSLLFVPVIAACSSDDITTLYEEPPKVPKDSFVLLPDASQRGYEPSGSTSYGSKNEWKRCKPYRIGTLVWYLNTTTENGSWRKFKWYIPGVIEDYVLNKWNKNEVIGYKIGIEKCMVGDSILKELAEAIATKVMLRWDEKIPECPVRGIDVKTSEMDTNSRTKKVINEYGEDLGFLGAKQNNQGPHMWGITLKQLHDVTQDPEYNAKMSMYDVVNTIVKPKTEETGMGYSLFLNKDKPLRAKTMVSHAWGENYSQFLNALSQSNREGPFWVCAMSIAQNNDVEEVTIAKQLGPDPKFGPFATVLKQADSMVAVMTKSCDIYSRLWCVYEIFVAISINIPVTLESYNEITGFGGSDKMYSNVVLDSTGKPVNTIEASCGFEGDKKMIHDEILNQEDGFALLDDVVMWVRIKSLIDHMPNCIEESWMETQMHVPIGTCSASNIVARQNAGIANALSVWQDAKNARNKEKNLISKTPTLDTNNESNTENLSSDKQESQMNSAGYYSVLRDKLCGGGYFF